MDLSIVLLIVSFCSAVAQNEFTVRVEQEVYQAEESSNITLTWTFPVDTNKSPDLHVDLQNVNLERSIYLYNSKMDTEPYLHELYRDRLHCDPQLAMKGRFECVLMDLRFSDAGTYQCIVGLNRKSGNKPCELKITAATQEPVEETPEPQSRGRTIFYVLLGLFTFVIILLLPLYLKFKSVSKS